MPKGDRSGVIATVVFAIVVIALGALTIWDMSAKHTLYSIQANQRSAEHAEQAENQIQQACSFADLARQTECIEEILQARDDAQRAEKDLEAQRSMAAWAMYAVIISGWLLLATATGVWYVRDTLVQTKRAVEETARATDATISAVEITREMGEAQARAYLTVTAGEIVYQSGVPPIINITIRNTGQSPALDVKAVYRVGTESELSAASKIGKGGITKVRISNLTQIIGADSAESLALGPTGETPLTQGNAMDPEMTAFHVEGVLEYKTVFDVKAGKIDRDTPFLFFCTTRSRVLFADLKSDIRSTHPMQPMWAFRSGWVNDYRKLMSGPTKVTYPDEDKPKPSA